MASDSDTGTTLTVLKIVQLGYVFATVSKDFAIAALYAFTYYIGLHVIVEL